MPCNTYDVGAWARHHSELFLRPPGEAMTYDRATPARMLGLLSELGKLTSLAETQIGMIAPSLFGSQLEQMRAELGLWNMRLSGYRANVDSAISLGQGPAEIWYCVTAPLLLGVKGNADCTGVQEPETQGPPDVGTPLELLNRAQCLSEANAGNSIVENYWKDTADYYGEAADSIARVIKESTDAVVRVAKAATPSKTTAVVVGSVVALAALLLLRR